VTEPTKVMMSSQEKKTFIFASASDFVSRKNCHFAEMDGWEGLLPKKSSKLRE
jgi:hypothetical protein